MNLDSLLGSRIEAEACYHQPHTSTHSAQENHKEDSTGIQAELNNKHFKKQAFPCLHRGHFLVGVAGSPPFLFCQP